MAEILDLLKEKLSAGNLSVEITFSKITNYNLLEIQKEKLIETAEVIKSDAGFDQLIDVVGTDRFTKKNRFELTYNLWSTSLKTRIFLRVHLDSNKPEIESLCSVWSSANWLEREAYDLFGIVFKNHPDLRRIYMMDEFQFYPLRKDYPLMGIPGAVELPKK